MKTISKQTIQFVGTAYTGSTLIGAALNAHSQMVYIGELARLPGYREKYGHYHYDAGCMQCLIDGSDCKIFSSKTIQKLSTIVPKEGIEYLRRITSKPIVVDGTKFVEWIRITRNDVVNTKVVILAKNPASYLQSCASRGIEPLWAEANAWRDTYYDALRTCSRMDLPCLVVRLEDYQKSPEKALHKLCDFIGVNFEKRMLSTTNFKTHALGGNPGAYVDTVESKTMRRLAEDLGQKEFDINPARLKSKILSKNTQNKRMVEYRQIVFETPGLVDIANILGYTHKDFV